MSEPNLPEISSTSRETLAINPLDLLLPLLKNRWLIGLIVTIALFLAIWYNLYTTPVYEAKASVVTRQNIPATLLREKETKLTQWADPRNALITKARIISSQPSAQELVKRLIDSGHFLEARKQTGWERLSQEQKTQWIQAVARGIQRGIIITIPRETSIIEIRYQSPDPELAKDVVNLLAEIAVEFDRNEQLIIYKDSLSNLNQQVDEARKRVGEAESKLYQYRRQHNIFEADRDKELIAERRSRLLEKLTEVQEGRKELESQISQLENLLQRRDYKKYTVLLPENQILVDLKQQLVTAEVTYQKLLIKYGEKHPEVEKTAKEIDILKQKFEQELGVALTRLQYNLNVVKSREQFLQESMAETEKSAVMSTEKDIEYVVLDREANSVRELYRTLLDAVKEVNVNTNSSVNNMIYVQEKALRPTVPIKPNKALNILLGLVLGIMMGGALAYVREFMDQTVRSPQDIERATQLPVLSTVPLYSATKNHKPSSSYRILFVTHRPKSLFTESIISLRSQLNIKIPQDSPKVILITSCAPQEGKSLIASNLALSLAMNGQKTLVLDADLHHPVQDRIFGYEKNTLGLYDLIVDTLNPQWSALDLKSLSLGDVQHMIQLKQWSGTIKIKWDSLPSSLTISYQEGRPAGSNLRTWKEQLALSNGCPPPKNLSFVLDESEIVDLDSGQESGMLAVEFLRQYPALSRSDYFAELIMREYIQDTENKNLHALTAGTTSKNPSEILGSEQMKILLKLLRERFDRIIIDAPPAWPLADVSVISPLTDWILWICRSGEIPKGMFQHTIQQIQRVQPNIIGVVMNAVDLHRDRYYYYGYPNYYYSSRYYRYRYHHTDYYGSSESGEPTENSPQ